LFDLKAQFNSKLFMAVSLSSAKVLAALAFGSFVSLPFLMSLPEKQLFAHERCQEQWAHYEAAKATGLRERMSLKRKHFYNCFYRAMHTQTRRWVPRLSDTINKPQS
jgi:hypothetical protein